MCAEARLLARIVRQRERRERRVERLGIGRAVDVAVRREGSLEIAAERLVRAQRGLEAVDDERHLRRQAAGLRLPQLRARAAFVAHGGEHLRQLEPHARRLGLLVEDRAEGQRRVGIALLARIHHAEAETRLGARLDHRVGGNRLVDRLGVGVAPGQMRLVRQIEELRGGQAGKRAPVVGNLRGCGGRRLWRRRLRCAGVHPGLSGLREGLRRNGGNQQGREEGHAQGHRLSYAKGSGCSMLLAHFQAGWMNPA